MLTGVLLGAFAVAFPAFTVWLLRASVWARSRPDATEVHALAHDLDQAMSADGGTDDIARYLIGAGWHRIPELEETTHG